MCANSIFQIWHVLGRAQTGLADVRRTLQWSIQVYTCAHAVHDAVLSCPFDSAFVEVMRTTIGGQSGRSGQSLRLRLGLRRGHSTGLQF